MRKKSITALRPGFEKLMRKQLKVRLHLHFQISGPNFSSYRKSLNQFTINISEPLIFGVFR